VRGLYDVDTSLEGGKAFIHNTTCASISIIILPGMILKGRVLLRARASSFIIRICLSISGTCSLAAVVLRLTPWLRSSRRRHSNSQSINAVLGLKPRALYSDIIFNNDLIRLGSDLLVTYSMVVNFIFREIVVTNGSPFTNMTSAAMVTSLLRSYIAFGIST
jgi:hypothetical protein